MSEPENLDYYLDLVTDEHRLRERFIATLTALVQPVVDLSAMEFLLPADFDLDLAVGTQLDAVGLWVGVTRFLQVPLEGVYFSLDEEGVGLDEGYWLGPFDPVTGLVTLPDDGYRTLLRAKIARNHWDGSLTGAYAAYAILFAGTGFSVLIQNDVPPLTNHFFSLDDDVRGLDSDAVWYGPGEGRLTMRISLCLMGSITPDAVTIALFKNNYLSLKGAGVMIENFVTQSVPGLPLFGLDAENDAIAGLDVGAWGILTAP